MVISDITERKETEKALKQSEEKFRSIYQSTNAAAIITIDEDDNIDTWNQGAELAFGYREDEILGQPLLGLIPERYRAAHEAGLKRAQESGKYRTIGKTVELSGLHRDGHEFPLELSLGVWTSGDKAYFSAIIIDITERKEAEGLFMQAKEEAEYANHAKVQFLANMNHELRTPLNGIIGFSEMMQQQTLGPLSEAYHSYATDIHQSALHLLELINDILNTSKIDLDEIDLVETNIVIPEMALACLKLQQAKAQESDISISLDIPKDLPLLRADETRIKQILLNLLSNAIKFTPAGGQVVMGAHCDDEGALKVFVKDNGRGIAAEDIPMVLEPFKQVEDIFTRSHEGSGLGLSLSKRLTELHGATLVVESEVGKGTTVTLTFQQERTMVS